MKTIPAFLPSALAGLALFSILAGFAASGGATPGQKSPALPAETPRQRDERMSWWREAKFGMFIHWGLYSVPAGTWKGLRGEGVGEWLMFTLKIPIPEYETLVGQFNPVRFDAAEWVRIARSAGMKYMVITSKHHDGFALFDSAASDYDIMATPFGRDPLLELAEECRRQGVRLGFYHSILDWHHPHYLPRGPGSPRPWDTRPAEDASLDRYLDTMKAQLRELLTRYGPVGILWFDGGWEHNPQELRSEEVVAMIRSLQPQIIINDRIMIPQDFDTPEQYIPATGLPGRDWETCMTMNDTWGYKSYDNNWKSSRDLIRTLVETVSKGGNLLLNVGPTAEGLIPRPSVERLADIGRWMNLYGESLYGATASPFRRLDWGRCTVKPGRLYLHVFDWPQDRLSVPGLRNFVQRAHLLADLKKTSLPVSREGEWVYIQLPAQPLDPADTVVVLEIKGTPDIAVLPLRPEADGTIHLKAKEADLRGKHVRYEPAADHDCLGYWNDKEDQASWFFEAIRPGPYAVSLTFACDQDDGGSEYFLAVGDQILEERVEATGSWTSFVTKELGKLTLPAAGRFTLTVRPKAIAAKALMNLRSITLKPLDGPVPQHGTSSQD